MTLSKSAMALIVACLAPITLGSQVNAATPSSCSIENLAGKWILFKSNMNGLQSSRCTITVGTNGSFTGNNACNDYRWDYKSSAYSISGKIALMSSVNSCYVSLTATAAGRVSVRGEGAINAGKDEISGFFTNSNPGAGPLSMIKVP